MSAMFQNDTKLTSLDLSSFDTSKVTDMGAMFYNCSNLKTIEVGSGFITDQVTYSASMFYGNNSLIGGNGTVFNSSYIDKTYARIDTAGTPGYFTRK